MKDFSTSLLREKFVIHDPYADPGEHKGPVVALSNRIVLELKNERGEPEIFAIRAQNMHSCIRVGAKLLQSHRQGGALLNRSVPYDWDAAWESTLSEYEQIFNPQRWVCIYVKGRVLFEKGEHHPLLDVIEKCQYANKGPYDDAVIMAEDAFKKTGKVVKLEYDGNVALVVNFQERHGRCGIILRGADKTTTFNFVAEQRSVPNSSAFNHAQALTVAAAFLEGIQMAFLVGMNDEKIRRGLIARPSPEEKQTREARRRLSRLNAEIANLESAFDVRYRPERPEFQSIMIDAEKLAQKILGPVVPEKKKPDTKA